MHALPPDTPAFEIIGSEVICRHWEERLLLPSGKTEDDWVRPHEIMNYRCGVTHVFKDLEIIGWSLVFPNGWAVMIDLLPEFGTNIVDVSIDRWREYEGRLVEFLNNNDAPIPHDATLLLMTIREVASRATTEDAIALDPVIFEQMFGTEEMRDAA